MTSKGIPVRGDISFAGMKQVNEHSVEYWAQLSGRKGIPAKPNNQNQPTVEGVG